MKFSEWVKLDGHRDTPGTKHRCHFVLVNVPAFRITKYPIRKAWRVRVYRCAACMALHKVDGEEIV